MAQTKPSTPMLRVASTAHMEKLKQQAERKRQREERDEIERAMQAQALAKDPTQAGIDMESIDRQAVVVTMHPNTRKVKRAERTSENVFDMITMEDHETGAGHRITEIWAEKMAMAGKPERDGSGSRGDAEHVPDRIERHRKLWNRIMTPEHGFGRMSVYPILFDALCSDIIQGQRWKAAEGARKPESQWRGIVKQLTGETQAHRQAGVIRMACAELYQILKDVDGRKA